MEFQRLLWYNLYDLIITALVSITIENVRIENVELMQYAYTMF